MLVTCGLFHKSANSFQPQQIVRFVCPPTRRFVSFKRAAKEVRRPGRTMSPKPSKSAPPRKLPILGMDSKPVPVDTHDCLLTTSPECLGTWPQTTHQKQSSDRLLSDNQVQSPSQSAHRGDGKWAGKRHQHNQFHTKHWQRCRILARTTEVTEQTQQPQTAQCATLWVPFDPFPVRVDEHDCNHDCGHNCGHHLDLMKSFQFPVGWDDASLGVSICTLLGGNLLHSTKKQTTQSK